MTKSTSLGALPEKLDQANTHKQGQGANIVLQSLGLCCCLT